MRENGRERERMRENGREWERMGERERTGENERFYMILSFTNKLFDIKRK
jgi:hypothetical protein